MNLPLNKNLLVEPYLNKKIFLQNGLLLLIVRHSLFQVNASFSIFKSDWVKYSNMCIHGLNITIATLLPATISIGSNWNRNLVLQAGHIAGRVARGKTSALKRISS